MALYPFPLFFKEIFSIKGRKTRSDFFWFWFSTRAFILIISWVILDSAGSANDAGIWIGILWLLFLVPTVCFAIRRLHDADHSAWFLLFGLIPYVGVPTLYIFLFFDKRGGNNKYGPDPRTHLSESESEDISL